MLAMPSMDALVARKLFSAWSRLRIGRARATRRYAGRRILSAAQTNEAVRSLVSGTRPAMISRLGASEIAAWANLQGIEAARSSSAMRRLHGRAMGLPADWSADVGRTLANNAGFFPATPEFLERYARSLGRWLAGVDLLAVMIERHEESALRQFAPDALLGEFMGLEPYLYPSPWTQALAGRRVLVVHPFAESIQRQFPRRKDLFADQPVLPDFELLTVKAVQSIAGAPVGFPDWFAALESMQAKIEGLDFDVAIIGAGAYGMPLAAFVKSLGRHAIHLGGSTQLLFGIKGRRWDTRPEVTRFYNEHWTRPLPHEAPANAQSVEDGCYW